MDSLVIRQLKVPTLIGVYEEERDAPQTLRMDIRLWLSEAQQAACCTDNLADALDYAAVAETVRQLASESSFYLLEALGDWLCAQVLETFACVRVDLSIYKDGCVPAAQGAEYHLSRPQPEGSVSW